VANYLWKTVPQLDALIIIDAQGNILEYRITPEFQKEHKMPWLEHIATIVSVRFKIAKFDKLMGGLEMTFNVFKENVMVVKPYGPSDILIIISNNEPSIEDKKQLVYVEKKFYSK